MDRAEVDAELEELENRLERLRALYQQYFLGIEKLEPQVPRKDVDRRIWLLRRAQIKNTRKRFKLNTIIQRYNTYQQYWQRILREIENGTYVRHLQKAKKRFGAMNEAMTGAERRRRRRFGIDGPASDDRGAAAVRDAENDLAAMLDSGADPATEAQKAVAEALAATTARAESPPAEAADAPKSEPAPKAAPAPAARGALDDLDLDLDFLGGDEAPKRKQRAGRPEASAKKAARQRAEANPPGRRRPPPPSRTQQDAPAPPSRAKQAPPPPPSRAKRAEEPSRPRSPAAARPRPPAATRPKPPAATRPKPDRAEPGRPAAGDPSRPKPPPRARPVAKTATKKVPARGPGGSDLSDERVRQLYNRLVEAKRSLNQSTRSVTVDGLAKSLRSTLPKLKQKHQGRKVDFDVVVKNGKAVVKPVVK